MRARAALRPHRSRCLRAELVGDQGERTDVRQVCSERQLDPGSQFLHTTGDLQQQRADGGECRAAPAKSLRRQLPPQAVRGAPLRMTLGTTRESKKASQAGPSCLQHRHRHRQWPTFTPEQCPTFSPEFTRRPIWRWINTDHLAVAGRHVARPDRRANHCRRHSRPPRLQRLPDRTRRPVNAQDQNQTDAEAQKQGKAA
jgi:hypothetical protein